MYITGDFSNFQARLHQLATSGLDLTTYAIEASGYTTASGLHYFWQREFRQIYHEISGSSNTGNFF